MKEGGEKVFLFLPVFIIVKRSEILNRTSYHNLSVRHIYFYNPGLVFVYLCVLYNFTVKEYRFVFLVA